MSGSGALNLGIWRFFCVVGVVGWGFGGWLFASLGGYLRVSEYICDFAGFICGFSIIFATRGGEGGSVERAAGWKGAAAGRILATFSFY